jgi:drug/metabolite transporter (DMT)-like permease
MSHSATASVLTLFSMALIAICIAVETASQLCLKQAASGKYDKKLFLRPILWLGIILWASEMLLWAHVLESIPLTIAFPMMALNYVVVMLMGAWVFRESITLRNGLGAMLITMGVACVGATGL